MKTFNELGNAEAEALALLAEEAAEVIQCVSKILRHGLQSTNPDKHHLHGGDRTNVQHLNKELGDMQAAINICHKYGMVTPIQVERSCLSKLRRIDTYLHHAKAP